MSSEQKPESKPGNLGPKFLIVFGIIVIGGFGLVVFVITSGVPLPSFRSTSGSTPTPTTASPSSSADDDTIIADAKQIVSGNTLSEELSGLPEISSPSTIKWIDASVERRAPPHYLVYLNFDAQNKNGATVRHCYIIEVDSMGGKYSVGSIQRTRGLDRKAAVECLFMALPDKKKVYGE